jgi:hypothetical protein
MEIASLNETTSGGGCVEDANKMSELKEERTNFIRQLPQARGLGVLLKKANK